MSQQNEDGLECNQTTSIIRWFRFATSLAINPIELAVSTNKPLLYHAFSVYVSIENVIECVRYSWTHTHTQASTFIRLLSSISANQIFFQHLMAVALQQRERFEHIRRPEGQDVCSGMLFSTYELAVWPIQSLNERQQWQNRLREVLKQKKIDNKMRGGESM